VGAYTVLVTVSDNGNGDPSQVLRDHESLTVVVRTSNQGSGLDSRGQSIRAGRSAAERPLQAIDPDGDPITYSATNLPPGANVAPLTGLLTWAPNLLEVGQYPGHRAERH